ncbi:MAG: hypothetical protein VKN56_01755, partial [Cyanobacteriota bacterium]|nr:hypothetical protein [Cyanobacteriota bacterium]
RLSAALDGCLGNPSSLQCDPWLFHQKLLEVYFEIYGRHRTLNEFVFNRLSSEKKIEHSMLTIEFAEEGSTEDFLIVEERKFLKEKFEKTVIRISNTLRQVLLPDTLQKSFFEKVTKENNIVDDSFLVSWLPRLRLIEEQDSEYMINKLSECIEDAYCRYTSQCSEARAQWINLFNYILLPEKRIRGDLKWSRQTRTNAKNILKALQGICLYQYFAKSSITSLAFEVEDEPGNVVGVTLGFNQGHPMHLLKTLQEVFSDYRNSILLKRKGLSRAPLIKPWNDVVTKESVSEMTAVKLANLFDQLQQLSFAKHEGASLKFTAYIGNQILMSRFRCISELDPNPKGDGRIIEYCNKHSCWHTMIKSHYSLFMDGRTGLFFDEASNDHVALVHPLPFPEEQRKDELKFNLDDLENSPDELGPAEYFLSLSHKCPKLTIVSVDEGRLVIYYNRKVIVEFSPRTDFKLEYLGNKDFIKDWSFINLKVLLERHIFDELIPDLEPYKKTSIIALAAAICHVSARPGCGGMIIFVNNPSASEHPILEGMRTELNDKQISYWREGHLYDHTSQSLVEMMIPDGSMLINLSNLRIENQVFVVPIKEGRVVQGDTELGKGTRHRTARGITSISHMNKEIWSICISADGGISVYFDGRKIAPNEINGSINPTPPQ